MWSMVIAGVGACVACFWGCLNGAYVYICMYVYGGTLCVMPQHHPTTNTTGLMFPIVVPPVRSMLGYNTTTHAPPSMRQVIVMGNCWVCARHHYLMVVCVVSTQRVPVAKHISFCSLRYHAYPHRSLRPTCRNGMSC